jgi:hypothetical protein
MDYNPYTRAQLQAIKKEPFNFAEIILQNILFGVVMAADQGKTSYIHEIKEDFSVFQKLLGEYNLEFLFPDSLVMYIETKTNGRVDRTIKIDWSN